MPVLTRSQSLGLAGRLAAAAGRAADADTAGTLLDVTADLVNHANGHPVPWLAAGQPAAATAARGLKTGDVVTLGQRTAVVETVALDGRSFTDTAGARHPAARAELVPVPAANGKRWSEMTPAENTSARERLARRAIARAQADGLPEVAAAQRKALARILAG